MQSTNIKQFCQENKLKTKFKKGTLYNSLFINDMEVIRSTLGKIDIFLLDEVFISNHHKEILLGDNNGKS